MPLTRVFRDVECVPVGRGWSSQNPYVILPYYTGRDKGCLCDEGRPLVFFGEGRAWKYISELPEDDRKWDNYRVVRLSEYLKSCD